MSDMLSNNKKPREFTGLFVLLRFYDAEFFFSDLIVAALSDNLIHNIFRDIHVGVFILDANPANGVARDVRVKRDLPNNIIRADVVRFALVDLQTDHALFMRGRAATLVTEILDGSVAFSNLSSSTVCCG
jgi:hypothetical protein